MTEFVGFDKDHQRVYRAPSGGLFTASSQKTAEAWVNYNQHCSIGIPEGQYVADFGPITKEK